MSEQAQLEKAIAHMESQRAILGDTVVDASIAALREKLADLESEPTARQRKQITILFADVSGFTALSETMDAEDVTDIMNGLWSRLDAVIKDHGGRIDKHIGDAVMALWGTPVAQEDDPQRAIHAALAMQAELSDFRAERSLALAMRIGINTGPVLLGEVGTTGEYTAMGDTVNVASRLEHAAPVDGVLVSYDTYRHVRGLFDVEWLKPIQVKGKAEPIQVYVVVRAKPRPLRVPTRGVQGIETRMVGRAAEFKRLQDAFYTAVEDRELQVVTIVGEAGVGKSRLLYEFANWAEVEPADAWVLQGRATQEMRQSPFALIRDLFSFGFEINDSDPAQTARQKLEQAILDFLGVRAVEKAHFIGHLIGFDFSGSPYLKGILEDVRQIHDRAFRYLTQFFAAMANNKPLLIYLEDIHWADDGSLDLIAHLTREQEGIRLLIVCNTRPDLFERGPLWGEGRAFHTRLDLHLLSKRDSRRLVDEILQKVPDIPQALRELMVSGAEGNPFYMEELVKVLIEDNVIVAGDDVWQVDMDRLVNVRVPATLTGVIQARLDRLSLLERETMQRAAVVGRVFWDGVVAQMDTISREELVKILSALHRKELVFKREAPVFEGEREYIFKHAILHEITYESVLKKDRKTYHGQVAAWLIEQGGERVNQYAGRIADHYELAGETILAGNWYGRAGEQAEGAYAVQAAVEYYQKALALTPDHLEYVPQRMEYYQGLGEMYIWQNRFEEAEESILFMKQMAEKGGDSEAESRAWLKLSKIQESQGSYRDALESAGNAVALAQEDASLEHLATCLLTQGSYAYMLGETDLAVMSGEQVLTLIEEAGIESTKVRAGALFLLGVIKGAQGQYEQALAYLEETLEIRRALGDRSGEIAGLNNLGYLNQSRGNYQAALKFYEDAYTIAKQIGDLNNQIAILSDIGSMRVELGDYSQAEGYLREAIQACKITGDKFSLAYASLYLAQALLGQGSVSQAFSIAQRTLVMMQGMEWQEFLGDAWQVLGRCLAEEDSPDQVVLGGKSYEARACFKESARVLAEMGAEGKRARTLREWARYEFEQGDKSRGESLWAEARQTFKRLGMDDEIARMNDERKH